MNDFEKYAGLHEKFLSAMKRVLRDLTKLLNEDLITKEEQHEKLRVQALELGKRFDQALMLEAGLKASTIRREPFEELAKGILRNNGIEPGRGLEELEPVKPRDVYTDRAFNQLIPGNKVEVSQSLKNYKIKWVHDVITESIWQWLVDNGLSHKQEPLFVVENSKQLIEAFRSLKQTDLPTVEFTDTDFRKITSRKKLSGEEIKQLMKDYSKSHISGELPVYWNGKSYKKLTISGNLFTVVCEEPEEFSPTNKKPIHRYTLLWNFWGFMLLNNLLQHRISSNDKDFYRLPGAEQNLDRVLSQSKKRLLSFHLSTMVEIMNLKIDSKHKRKQKARIINHLESLKKKSRIKWFKTDSTGEEVKFQIGIR